MGFGIVLLGYILTLFDSFGGGIVGCPLMAYGFFKLNKLNQKFGVCAAISVISVYEPVLQVLAILGKVNGESTAFMTAHIVSFAVKMALLVTFYYGVFRVAQGAKSEKMMAGSLQRMFFTAIVYVAMIASAFIDFNQTEIIINIAFILSGIVNILYMWDCCAKITTPSLMLKEKWQLKKLEDEEKKKREKRKKKTDDE